MAYTKPGVTRNRIYQFVRQRLLDGEPPTVREVQTAFHMRAVQSAKSHLDALVKEGRLVKVPGKSRGYRLPGTAHSSRLAPILGRVPAGPFNIAVEEIEGYIPVRFNSEEQTVFGLRVNGDSMMSAGILHGDIVLVRSESEIHQGDIVVAMVDGEATVKEFRRVRNRIQLRPHNDAYPVLSPKPEDLTIIGKVIEVRRYLEAISLIDEELNG